MTKRFPFFAFGHYLSADFLHCVNMRNDFISFQLVQAVHHADFQPHRCKIRIHVQLLPFSADIVFHQPVIAVTVFTEPMQPFQQNTHILPGGFRPLRLAFRQKCNSGYENTAAVFQDKLRAFLYARKRMVKSRGSAPSTFAIESRQLWTSSRVMQRE